MRCGGGGGRGGADNVNVQREPLHPGHTSGRQGGLCTGRQAAQHPEDQHVSVDTKHRALVPPQGRRAAWVAASASTWGHALEGLLTQSLHPQQCTPRAARTAVGSVSIATRNASLMAVNMFICLRSPPSAAAAADSHLDPDSPRRQPCNVRVCCNNKAPSRSTRCTTEQLLQGVRFALAPNTQQHSTRTRPMPTGRLYQGAREGCNRHEPA